MVNRRRLLLTKLLGEGGFSFVYLVEDVATKRRFALKKITCHDTEQLRSALREVELYRLFDHPNIIRVVDSCSVTSPRGDNDVYVLLPLYKRGNLQELIDSMDKEGKYFSENELLILFHGVCQGLREIHSFRPVGHDTHPGLVHRDVKPANILLSGDNTPVLMDFGSMGKARVNIKNRKDALALQDLAAERCTMPYRAPELFDVPTGCVIDERIDIWSLGCTLYCMAYHKSPFEDTMAGQGGSIALAALSGKIQFPQVDKYSPAIRSLIMYMLAAEREERPHIEQ
eukprot:Ihof_evm1s775 gene=Ihof_evmTU1s775